MVCIYILNSFSSLDVLMFFCHSPIHTYIDTLHLCAALFSLGFSILTKDTLARRLGKTGMEEDNHFTPEPQT